MEYSSGNVSVEKVQDIICGGPRPVTYITAASTEYIFVPGLITFAHGKPSNLYRQSVSPTPEPPNATALDNAEEAAIAFLDFGMFSVVAYSPVALASVQAVASP